MFYCREWEKELDKAKIKREYDPSLFKAMVRAFWPEAIVLGILLFTIDFGVRLISPTLLGGMLQYFRPGSLTTREEALYYAGGMVLCNLISMMFMNHYMVGCFHFGMKLRVASCAVIYKKVSFAIFFKNYTEIR